FGTYRTTYQNPLHVEALNYALDNGITDIDTSSNYMYGEAEMLVGNALQSRDREKICVVTKGGYIQGPNMQRVKEGWMVEDLVEYSPECFHSISPQFLSDQIDNSLKRLQTSYIDIYLLHNPEYYLMSNLKSNATDDEIKKHHQIMQDRVKKAFAFLETMVEKGKIRGYGISSNSFSKKPNDYHFLEYKHLIGYAKEIAGENHHFKAIQLPMNIYEKDGTPTARYFNENGIEVQINRPLNAFYMGGMLRLASYSTCSNYNELLKKVKEIPSKHLQDLIDDIIKKQSEFKFCGDVDDTVEYQVIPYIVQNIRLDEKYFEVIDEFLECYKRNIKHAISKIVAKNLNLSEPLDKEALEFLANKKYVSKTLIGMRHIDYVKNALSYNL
ncbi:MAG: aldo/keto reductase, partial [Campylobacterota bacterium]|nr:aldo/keto reductase [Campylobacterota bacterium]